MSTGNCPLIGLNDLWIRKHNSYFIMYVFIVDMNNEKTTAHFRDAFDSLDSPFIAAGLWLDCVIIGWRI